MTLDSRQFLSKLEADVAAKSIEIAGFPSACIRLMRELRDPFASNNVVANLVRQDDGLTKRVILMANSAAYRSSSGEFTDAKAAVARIGLAALRTVVIAYAFSYLKEREAYRTISSRMGEIIDRGVTMASISRVLLGMQLGRRIDRETVGLSGLLAGVGKLYVLTEAAQHPEVLIDFAALEHLTTTWGPRFTKKLLTEWGFSEEIIKAASAIDGPRSGDPDDIVGDILYVSSVFADFKQDREELAKKLQVSAPAARVGVAALDPATIFKAAEEEAASMHGATG